jgi:hypothetical protein
VSSASSGGGDELKYQGVELANAKLSAADREEGKDDDMITLPHLHEPAILHAISERYDLGKIYTWTGPVLIAVNPFQRLPLYTPVSDPFLTTHWPLRYSSFSTHTDNLRRMCWRPIVAKACSGRRG